MILIEQHRQPLNKTVIELPAGIIDPGTTAEATAHNELLQESGYKCQTLTFACEGAPSPGLVNETNTIYRASGLVRDSDATKDTTDHDDVIHHGTTYGNKNEGEDIQSWEVPLKQVTTWLDQRRQNGAVIDLRIYAALPFAQDPDKLGGTIT